MPNSKALIGFISFQVKPVHGEITLVLRKEEDVNQFGGSISVAAETILNELCIVCVEQRY